MDPTHGRKQASQFISFLSIKRKKNSISLPLAGSSEAVRSTNKIPQLNLLPKQIEFPPARSCFASKPLPRIQMHKNEEEQLSRLHKWASSADVGEHLNKWPPTAPTWVSGCTNGCRPPTGASSCTRRWR